MLNRIHLDEVQPENSKSEIIGGGCGYPVGITIRIRRTIQQYLYTDSLDTPIVFQPHMEKFQTLVQA
jgi:hypothetical protein